MKLKVVDVGNDNGTVALVNEENGQVVAMMVLPEAAQQMVDRVNFAEHSLKWLPFFEKRYTSFDNQQGKEKSWKNFSRGLVTLAKTILDEWEVNDVDK